MLKRLAPLLILAALLCLSLPDKALAAGSPGSEKGLLITPIRQFLSVDAGNTLTSTFTVANLNSTPMAITLSVKRFSVADYTYDYRFSHPDNDWLHLDIASVVLQAHQTKDVGFHVAVPSGTAPGGHYYTLFASANLSSQGVNNTIQAADLVYLTVNGKLTTVSHLEGSSIHVLNFGHSIPFTLKPVNTGNIYSFVYVSGQLHGLFVRPPQTSSAHLLMPGKVRALVDSIPSPVLPGIYRATYGYRTPSNWIIQQSRWVVFIPPWFIAFVLAALLLAGKFLPRRKRKDTKPTSDASKE